MWSRKTGSIVLVAYEGGLIILWDIVEAKILVVRGDIALQLENVVGSPSDADSKIQDVTSQHPLEGKEISSLCWVSQDGSILAVGYVDGDILFWKMSTASPIKGQHHASTNNVVKLQLSSAEKRIPVIVLHWLSSNKSHKEGSGHLLIYGGDDIGSDEVLTVLALEWSAGMESLKCLGRKDLNLSGSFADIVLASGTLGSDNDAAMFLLTNPGQLQVFCCSSLSSSVLKEKGVSITAVDFPAVIPTVNPLITVSDLFHLPTNGDSSKAMSEIASITKSSLPVTLPGHGTWRLTGGVHSHLLSDSRNKIGRVFVAGYQDGSVRMWDATYPVLSFLCALENQIGGRNVTISIASVSKLDFCFQTLRLAVGDECGLVCLYEINSSVDTSFHFIKEAKHEVHQLPRVQGPKCRAAISFLNSRIEELEFTNSGAKLAIGYECCRIAVLDMNSLSALFLTDIISSPSSPLTSMICKEFIGGQVEHLKHSGIRGTDGQVKNLIFMLTKDGAVYVIDSGSGNRISPHPMRLKRDSTAVSLYVIERSTKASKVLFESQKQQLKDRALGTDSFPDKDTSGNYDCETDPSESHPSQDLLDELLVLVCCRDILRLYAAKSVIQGDNKPICKIKLTKPCCWTTTFLKDEKICGLLLLYQTGDLELRSLPDLKLVKEAALVPLLRWNFKANMEKTMSSTNNGHIALVNGSELAFMSILVNSNDFRIPESLPSLHDEVLAAAARAAMSLSSAHDKKQGNSPRILSGIIRGFKGEKANRNVNPASTSESCLCHLEDVFTRDPFLKPSTATDNHLDAAELNIDDIEIDEPMPLPSSSNNEVQDEKKKNKADREKLLGVDTDAKPRLRTREEIIATYRKTEGASSAAGEARNKLLERQEKLERINKRTEELQSGAEDFASLANELVKVMESRKWWHI